MPESPSEPVSPASSGRCQAPTKKGQPCPNPAAEGRPYCLPHDPDRAEERRARMAELGKSGAKKKRERQAKAAISGNPLATTEDIRAALERALAAVERSGADPLAKADKIARLCGVALGLRRTVEIEAELEALRRLFEERIGPLRYS
jgi:hypothetical protein